MTQYTIDFRAGGDLVSEPADTNAGRVMIPAQRNYRVKFANDDWSSWLTANELNLVLAQEEWTRKPDAKPGVSLVTALMTAAAFNAKTSSDPEGKRLGKAITIKRYEPTHKALIEADERRFQSLPMDELMKELGL